MTAEGMSLNGKHGWSMPRALLHLEGAALFFLATVLYFRQGFAWWVFLLLLLFPDLSMAGYLGGSRLGSMIYNLVHTIILPLSLGLAAYWINWPLGQQIALIWLAHIGMDRMVGYGLKYPDAFKHTHFDQV